MFIFANTLRPMGKKNQVTVQVLTTATLIMLKIFSHPFLFIHRFVDF